MANKALVVAVFVVMCLLVHHTNAAAFIQKQLTFDNCGSSNSIFQVEKLDVDPYPPRNGESVSLVATINSREPVTGGRVHVTVKGTGLLSMLSLTKDYDLCSVIPTPCPISKGPATISITRKIPRSPVTGLFNVEIKAVSDGGEELLCAKLPLEIN